MKPIPTIPADSTLTSPSKILDDVGKLGVNSSLEVVGGEENAKKLMNKVAELKATGVRVEEMGARKTGQKETVESEVVVTAEELKKNRERRVRETEDREREEKGQEGVQEEGLADAEKGEGRDRASGNTGALEGEKETEAKEKKVKEAEGIKGGKEGDAEEKKPDEEVASGETEELAIGDTEKVGSDQGTEIIGGEEGEKAEKAEGDCMEITEEVARETGIVEKGKQEGPRGEQGDSQEDWLGFWPPTKGSKKRGI